MVIEETTLRPELETSPEIRLWQAVILSAVEDWISGGLRTKRQAEAYLFEDNADFCIVCESAGMNPEALRSRLNRLRHKRAA
jgi:hypothetical protein